MPYFDHASLASAMHLYLLTTAVRSWNPTPSDASPGQWCYYDLSPSEHIHTRLLDFRLC